MKELPPEDSPGYVEIVKVPIYGNGFIYLPLIIVLIVIVMVLIKD